MNIEQCSDCDADVEPGDLYFATPCGTFCRECMESKHARECGVCASEFDLETTCDCKRANGPRALCICPTPEAAA